MYSVTQLVRYPVKSTRPEILERMELDQFGPAWDRRFMFVDEDGKFLSQRTVPVLARLSVRVEEKGIAFRFGDWHIHLSIEDFVEPTLVSVWGDEVRALGLHKHAVDNFASDMFNRKARLVFMSDTASRIADPAFSKDGSIVAFSDGFPFLLCNKASLDDLNQRLESPVPMWRFRPNIVFDGVRAFEESEWKRIRIGSIEFDLVKPCSRCSMTTLDEQLRFNKEPLKTLASYRKNEYGVCFGENMVHRAQGAIALGMTLEVIE